ncbi:macro domain-containing protein [Bacteroides sp.]|uniref:macro domain-containing protein n=1 Tax=Bacteroides sp. TaxID=29523 RepID=UPI00260388DE|nr:macro domain-containing protein [Bacteroides sp.]MDD3039059.1 macro domain-containing protein [Bacteroides sp.]
MIEYKSGNIFDSKCQTLVNPVNCVGVMGAGLAKQFRDRYPDINVPYRKTCSHNELRIGSPWLFSFPEINILCFPTKLPWKDPSKLEYIEAGLISFRNNDQHPITSIAFPPLGTGLGSLPKQDVKQLMEHYLEDIDIPIEI